MSQPTSDQERSLHRLAEFGTLHADPRGADGTIEAAVWIGGTKRRYTVNEDGSVLDRHSGVVLTPEALDDFAP